MIGLQGDERNCYYVVVLSLIFATARSLCEIPSSVYNKTHRYLSIILENTVWFWFWFPIISIKLKSIFELEEASSNLQVQRQPMSIQPIFGYRYFQQPFSILIGAFTQSIFISVYIGYTQKIFFNFIQCIYLYIMSLIAIITHVQFVFCFILFLQIF